MNSTNVTLTGLKAENASIVLNNVFGEVNISHFKSRNYNKLTTSIGFTWTVAQSQYIPYTVVALHELDLTFGVSFSMEVSISGCIPGKIVLMNSTFIGSDDNFYVIHMESCLVPRNAVCV